MRAWKVREFGEPIDVVKLEENVDAPSPGAGELRLKVEVAGLGLPDVLMCHDNYPLVPPLPFTPSQEAVGEVLEVGEGVDSSLVGQRVLGPTQFQAQWGGLAEECLMMSQMALPIPEAMSGEEAAGFFIPFQTAWIGLVRRANLQAGDTVLVLGASGSSGSAAVQLARARGARVIAVAGGPDKAAFCEGLGADEVIDHRREDITERALALTDGRGVSVVYDPVGGKAGRAAFKATAFEGRFVIIGYASGEWPSISLVETLPKNISLVGAMPVGYSPEYMRESHEALLQHWEQGQLSILGNKAYTFEQGAEAIAAIGSRNTEGKVVVRVRNR